MLTFYNLLNEVIFLQSNQNPFEPPMANGEDSDMMFLNVDMGEDEIGEDNMADLLIGDMFTNMWGGPAGSPRRTDDDPATSPQAHHHHQTSYHHQDENSTVSIFSFFITALLMLFKIA